MCSARGSQPAVLPSTATSVARCLARDGHAVLTAANGTNRDIWTDHEGIHQMRRQTIAQDMTKAFPEANVRRVEVRKSVHGAQRLQVHGRARSRHRTLVARWDPRRRSAHSSAAFVSRLQENLVSRRPSASLS